MHTFKWEITIKRFIYISISYSVAVWALWISDIMLFTVFANPLNELIAFHVDYYRTVVSECQVSFWFFSTIMQSLAKVTLTYWKTGLNKWHPSFFDLQLFGKEQILNIFLSPLQYLVLMGSTCHEKIRWYVERLNSAAWAGGEGQLEWFVSILYSIVFKNSIHVDCLSL